MPISMAVFDGDPFTQASMIRGIEKRPYIPNGLDAVIGFEPVSVSSRQVYIGQKNYTPGIIQTTLRGAPLEAVTRPTLNYRPIGIPRVGALDQLFAHEIADLLPLEDESDEDIVAARIAEMWETLIDSLSLTEENMRLGALNGSVLDKDGTTIVNYHTEFGVAVPAAVDLTLDDPAMTIGALIEKIGSLLTIPISRASATGSGAGVRMRALCGDTFWFKLIGHPAVTATYANYAAAAALREMKVWESFTFGNVEWFHYRGTDDGTSISINTNQAKVFPYGLRGMFQHIMGPADEFLDGQRRRGVRYTPILVRDIHRNQWVQPEIYAYPLFVNARPDLVLTATV